MFGLERKSLNDVVELVNDDVRSMFFEESIGHNLQLRANVCCSCDRLLCYRDVGYISVKDLRKNSLALRCARENIDVCIKDDYKYRGKGSTRRPFLRKLLMSPRSCFVKRGSRGVTSDSFVCCDSCALSIRKGNIPKYGIGNFMLGCAPDVLSCLSDIELAYISPVRVFSHLFAAFGGKNAKMRGYHSFMKVDVEQVYNHTLLIDDIVSSNSISVVLSGAFTKKQKELTMSRYSIRLDRVKAALSWLRVHNVHYSGIKQFDIESMPVPVINISDHSDDVESEDGCIEVLESFRVVFPDGYLNDKSGGKKKVSEFKELIRELEGNGHELSVFSRSLSQVCPDYSGNFLTAAFPKVFPYGIGGPDDVRFDNDGAINNDGLYLQDYIKHVSQLSHNAAQESLFSLVMFNINVKQSMVRNAGWVSRRNVDLTSAVSELNGTDVVDAVQTETYQSQPTLSAANHLLSSVDLISRYLPHGSGAAKQARGNIEALCHRYGDMCYFLTVNPDEENNVVLQVYSGNDIDLSSKHDLSKIDTSTLREKAVLRQKLSCKYPGYSSYYFEQVVDMVVKHIIGWDVSSGKPVKGGGFFGVPEAYVGATEEQGRGRLHIHFGVWVKGINDIRECAFSGNVTNDVLSLARKNVRRSELFYVDKCRDFLCEEVDRISSSRVLSPIDRLFKHNCNSTMKSCSPVACSDQKLRNMRHSEGCGIEKGEIVKCGDCGFGFNTTDIGLRCLEHMNKCLPREDRLFTPLCLTDRKYQPNFDTSVSVNRNIYIEDAVNYVIIKASRDYLYKFKTNFNVSSLVNYAKNIHSAYHAKSCWKKGCECRYRFPKKASIKTHISCDDNVSCKWYNHDGTFDNRVIMGIEEERSKYDVFSNSYFLPLSHSLLMCNTNVRLLTPGPIVMYVSKYLTKSTQKDDTEDFDYMLSKLQKRLLKKKKVTEFSEGMSRIIAATFIHNSQNVIGAPLAKYLTTNKSRFQYSHNFVYVPAEDIGKILKGEGVKMRVNRSVGGTRFLSNSGYDYIHRPACLEHLDPVTFYSHYEVILKRPNSKRETFEFESESHPAYKYQVVAMRHVPLVPKLRAYSFPDTKELNGNMYDPTYEVTSISEHYAYMIMLHFLSYRTSYDLRQNGSYVELLREVRESNRNRLNPSTFSYLRNMQNQRNNFRLKSVSDELERGTTEFVAEGGKKKKSKGGTEEEEIGYADFLCSIYDEMEKDEVDCFSDDELPASFSMGSLCRKGLSKFANVDSIADDLCDNPTPSFVDNAPDVLKDIFTATDFVSSAAAENNTNSASDNAQQSETHVDIGGKITKFSLVSLAGRNCRRRVESNLETRVEVVANGSAESIIQWGEQQMTDERGRVCNLDAGQRAAFQCMTSSFILTYYRDAQKGMDIGSDEDSSNDLLHGEAFENNKKNLVALANNVKDFLIMFFSGPGGSGKSECIRQTILYCRKFCENLGVKFTKNTIRVTALTGVAAVAINGETIDSAACLCKDINKLDTNDYDAWCECRLLIVDEVSFMGCDKLIKLHKVLNRLRGNYAAFGGLNIVFCGDFRQLEPITKKRGDPSRGPIYCAEGLGKHLFWDAVNCYVELTGIHRFDGDVEWGQILFRLRNGEPTAEDIELINQRLMHHLRQHQNERVPDNARYATYRNSTRDRINSQLSSKRVKENAVNGLATNDHIMIFCDDLCAKEKTDREDAAKYVSFKGKKDFWTNVGESDCVPNRSGRFEPVLKLWKFSEVMLTDNDVANGKANGTQLNVISVMLNDGESVGEVAMDGVRVNAILAKQVKYLLCYDKQQKVLKKILPEKSFFKARFPVPKEHRSQRSSSVEHLQMRAVQLPVVTNNATTGYKLQGAGVENIVVTEYAPKNVRNWIYVLLSRVRTRHGLFLKNKIPSDLSLYSVPKPLKDMLSGFAEKCMCQAKTLGDLSYV